MNFIPFILKSSDDKELINFLDKIGVRSESVLGYHYPIFRDMLLSIGVGYPNYIGLRNEQKELCAVLPGFIRTVKEGTVYSSLPFFGPNAGVLCDSLSIEKEEIHKQLFGFLFEDLNNYDMISASIYSPFCISNLIIKYEQLIPNSITVEKFTNYILLEGFSLNSSLEYDIRKAIKSGVKIRGVNCENDVTTIYEIYERNCFDYGIPLKPKKCIDFLTEIGKNNDIAKTYIAELENKIIGSLIMIYSPSTASYFLPCSVHEYRSYQPTTLLINHAINESIESGIKIWNWESSPSKDSGVYRFKKKWGSFEGRYKIFVRTFKDIEFFKSLGQQKIKELFPYFYIYPFNKI